MTGLHSSFTRRAAAVGAAVLCTGCLPHIMHGPRIEDDGLSGSLSLTLGHNREAGELDPEILPSLYGGLRTSKVPADGDGTAISFGVQVPVLFAPLFANEDDTLDALASTSYLDVYVQPQRRPQPGLEWGVGALASTALAGPYVQVGRMQPDGGGWYTTQLVVFVIGDAFGDNGAYYLPNVVWRYRDPSRTTAANLSVGVGVGVQDGIGTDALVTLGVTLELGLGTK